MMKKKDIQVQLNLICLLWHQRMNPNISRGVNKVRLSMLIPLYQAINLFVNTIVRYYTCIHDTRIFT